MNKGKQKFMTPAMERAMAKANIIMKRYFNIMPDKENEADTVAAISNGVSFHGSTLWILVFAIFIASLGLNVNSTAVIIGAMLISPLMGPIIGMGLAVGINDFELLKRSAKNYLVATLISVVTATVYFLLTPLNEAQSELLARTSPSLYDVLIALCGGAAGIVALSCKGKGNVLPGVAIATALMPPLCTAGYGLATGNIYYFLGAFYLFFINTVFISLATYLGVRMMKFETKRFLDFELEKRVHRYIIIAVVATMVPAGIMTFGIVKASILNGNVSRFVKERLDGNGTRIISYETNRDSMTLRVVAVGREISDSVVKHAEADMAKYKIGKYRLQVIQGTQSDSVMLLNNSVTRMRTTADNYAAMLREETEKSRIIQEKLDSYTRFDTSTADVAKEIKALFPTVTAIGLSTMSIADTDTAATHRRPLAIVSMKPGSTLGATDRNKLSGWLKERLNTDNIRLIITNEKLK